MFVSLFTHGALKSSYELAKTCPCVPDRIGIWNCWIFKERGKPEYPKKNLSEEGREPTTNSTQIWHVRYSRIRTGPHWWEASAVTTAADLLPMRDT